MSNYPDDDLDLVDPHDDRHQQVKPPSVVVEEDVFSSDETSSESPDIDDELEKVGLKGDSEEGPQDLGVDKKID